MAKQLNVNLSFNADTSKAKAQLQDLQNSLNQLMLNANKTNSEFGLNKELTQAITQVTELQSILQSAKTQAGTLDLGKLNLNMKKNNKDISDYAKALSSLGPKGEQAFAKLAQSITTAEIPLRRSSGLLTQFATTLKNTVRWQLSSSVLHGFMGAVQGAYGYAQDLNESLNNIRIVTGQNTDQMAKFANEANKAAKALSTTTTAYTDAALIYYQQGLDDNQVKERTDITIKMANVSRQSAEEVSDQMTAVWNNFAKGSESLEHFADVMTRLGADTASSSDEIAQGLEKFAAIADMIGLSFDNAAAALATVTATTRQSADVVGTAFKTIFARIQGLSLGETLDDGTNLNKYSKALEAVGINIKNQNGELKDMDSILEEMGAKWNTLSKDQQVALAQTVAGVRQYNQLIALMDNFDFYQKNLNAAQNSDGSLQQQADIYAESWEAAKKRVKAAAQDIYDSILDDKFFIALTNGFGKFLDVIGNTTDALGGLPGVLSIASALLFKMFGPDMASSIDRWGYNIKLRSKEGTQAILDMRKQTNQELRTMFADNVDNNIVNSTKADVYTKQANLQDTLLVKQQELVAQGTKLTEEEQKQATLLLEINDQLGQSVIKNAEQLDAQISISDQLEQQYQVQLRTAQKRGTIGSGDVSHLTNEINKVKDLQTQYGLLSSISSKLNKSKDFNSAVQDLKNLSEAAKKAGIEFSDIDKIIAQTFGPNSTIKDIETLRNAVQDAMYDIGADAEINFDKIRNKAELAGMNMQELNPILDKMQQSFTATGRLTAEQVQILKDYGFSVEEATEKLKGMHGQIPTLSQGIVALGQTLSTVSMTITSIKGLFDTWNNEDMSFGDKLISTFTTLGMIIPMVTTSFRMQNLAQMATVSSSIAAAFGFSGEAQAAVAAGTATAGFGATLWTVLWPIGLVIASVTLLAGVIAGLINIYNKDANASKKAQEELNTANQILTDTKQKYEEVADAIKTYEESVNTLSKVKRGTEEWDDAVKDLNTDVLELLKSYSGLAQYITNEDGVLTISKEGLNWLEETQAKNVRTAEINSYNAQIRANKAENRSDTTDLSREITVIVPDGENTYDAFDRNITESVLNAIVENGNAIFADTKDSSAQDNLANALYGVDFDELNSIQQEVVDASIENSDKLMQLAADIEANSQANRILTEQIANSALADNSKYNVAGDDAQNAVDQIVANALENVDDSTWSKTYLGADRTALNDKEIQAEYAKLMGWDTTNIGNKTGYGEYNLADGTTYKVDDTTARYALNQQKKLEELTGVGGTSDKAITDFAELSVDAMDVDNMKEYLEYREDYYKVAQDTYNLTDEQIEKLLQESTAVGELAKSYDIASEMAAKFNGEENPDDKYYEEMAKAMEGLSDEELSIALDVLADSATLEEFQAKFEQACTDAMVNSWNVSAETMKTIMDEGSKEGKFSDENIASLESDNGFIESLKEQGISFKEFQLQTFDEQYAMVLRYYQDINAASFEAYETQKSYLTQEKLDKEAQLSALRAAQEEYNQLILDGKDKQAEKLAEEFEDTWDIKITTDVSEAESELDIINDKLEELEDKHIEIAIDWDGIDEIENGIKQTAEFTKLLKDETKKVGNSYQMTAAQAKDWMQVYPDLFKNATVTTDGLISLDEAYVNDFIDGKEVMSDASIEQKLLDLEAEEARLLAEKESLQAEFDAVKAVKEGEMNAEQLSAEQLSDLHSRLTQYYIDLGYDEAEAHAQALNDMGLDEETYSELVADAAETNAKNQAKAAKEGADAQAQALSELSGLWQKFVNGLKKVAQAVKRALTGEEVDETFGDISPSVSVDDGSFSGYSMTKVFEGTDKSSILDAFDKGSFDSTLDGITLDMSEIDAALASIKNQKTYLEALKNQDLDDFNSTDPDDVDGTNKKGSDKKADIKDLTEVLERYHEINEEIKMQERLIDRLSKAKDRAYGQDKIKLMEQEIEATKVMLNKQKQLYDAQTAFLAIDKAKVIEKFGNAEFDDYGNITNYTKLLENATEALNAAKKDYNASQSEADKEALENAEKEYDKQVKLLQQYEETLNAWHDQADILTDLRNQIQDLNYEKLQEALNLKIEIDEADLKRLDYFLNKFSDDFYKMAESAALMRDKIEPTTNILGTYKENVNKLSDAYQRGDISQADYIDGLKNARDGIYEQLEALNELDKQMLHYYEDTLAAATDELADHTDHMEHLTSVFEHYQNLLGILGKSKDYEAMGDFLQGQADTIKDRLSVAQSYYDVLLQQKDEIQAELQAAIASGDEAAIEMYQKEWDAIVDETDAAQEKVLTLTEEWAEAMKSVIQNNMEKIADTLEKTLTGGTTFDTLMDGFDKLNTRQEEYLTKTNQIYETNKLMRTASKALDETDNKVAKQKLKNFIDETKGLQETTQLSKYELEIQQAKYDLLLAQIALEEAQNAKSTVRLSRDSEGNFGYVYTADQNKIDDAQQAVDDADNKLYNLSLEGQQQYTEKYLQAEQAMYEELKQLQQDYLDGNIASEEEYELRKSQIQEHYLGPEGVLTTYSKLYNIAVQTDANATADYWGQEYGRMTQDTEAWKTAVNDYLLEIDDQIDEWKNVQNQANKEVQGALNNSEKATKELTDESKKLRDTLNNKVIPSIEKEIDAVREQTDAYANQRAELLALIATYERYLATLNKQIASASNGNIDYSFEASKAFVAGDSKGVSSNLALREDKAIVGVNTSVSGERLGNVFAAASGDSSYTKQQQNDAKNLVTNVASGKSKYTDKTLSAIGFSSGGYTGDWGPEGKLAILHEKELVLNQDDTKNILSTVSLIRELVSMIDAQAANASLFNLISTQIPNNNTNTLEQKVEITAEFPNVNDRYEIEEAFNNLVNRASQYANKAF